MPGGKDRDRETAGENEEIKIGRLGVPNARLAPDSPGDSPALLASTVIFYWVYDVINLIARPAHGLNRDASESVDTARPMPRTHIPSLPACAVISGIFGTAADLGRDTLECVNYRLYGLTVLSFHFREFNERL